MIHTRETTKAHTRTHRHTHTNTNTHTHTRTHTHARTHTRAHTHTHTHTRAHTHTHTHTHTHKGFGSRVFLALRLISLLVSAHWRCPTRRGSQVDSSRRGVSRNNHDVVARRGQRAELAQSGSAKTCTGEGAVEDWCCSRSSR